MAGHFSQGENSSSIYELLYLPSFSLFKHPLGMTRFVLSDFHYSPNKQDILDEDQNRRIEINRVRIRGFFSSVI